MTFIMGVDLGQANDPTAIVITEKRAEPGQPNELQARHVERIALGTPYPKQVEHIVELAGRPELGGDVQIALDATGVGRPVMDMVRPRLRNQLGLRAIGITITAGSAVVRKGLDWRIPKRDLIAAAQVAFQSRRLKVSRKLPDVDTMLNELQAYRVSLTDDGRDTYGNDWRQAPHDDLVLALAISVYVADMPPRRGPRMVGSGSTAGGWVGRVVATAR